MSQGNGKAAGLFETGGPMAADGSMFVHVRLEGSSSQDWFVALLAINPTRGNQPPDQRNRLGLTPEDAAKLGIPIAGALKRIEVAGKPDPLHLSAVCTIVPGNIPASVLAVDTLAGVLHIDGPGGSWSWKVKR